MKKVFKMISIMLVVVLTVLSFGACQGGQKGSGSSSAPELSSSSSSSGSEESSSVDDEVEGAQLRAAMKRSINFDRFFF